MTQTSFLHGLSEAQKAELFEQFITGLERTNREYGGIIGTIQLIAQLEQNAIVAGMHSCPYCGGTRGAR